ncbi:uncharacterized protein LOC120273196 [Dioscorea cayenensis subsp. rotundata]|uniref:Uncharacterized protein LOC120273196 n=1 Tax=Dioscorea cayennensis subsp. rotundata TaxID=55577 RepID=A0AB40C832_DIOCR|nr:uncharacterized protein LOC120273196 [Dioscorea cayenensis subsp. rotundata]
MATNGSGSGSSQTNVPPFNRESYNLWSLKMETILLSCNLWGMVEKGYNEEEEDKQELSDPTIIGKILRSLTLKFSHVVSSIIESKDMSSLTVKELSGSLGGHEGRLDLEQDHTEEEGEAEVASEVAYVVKEEGEAQRPKAFKCWYKDKAMNFAEEEEITHLFMGSRGSSNEHENVSLLDSGYSNHMTVKIGDKNVLKVAGIGSLLFKSKTGKLRELSNVQDKESNSLLAQVQMTQHKLFPLSVDEVGLAHVSCKGDASILCHMRYAWVYFLQTKSHAFKSFKMYKIMAEKQLKRSIKVLRTDRGGEFTSREFQLFCEENDVKCQLIAPHTPQQNGVVEQKNRTVVEMAHCMLMEKSVPTNLWGEAVSTVVTC